MAYVAPHVDDEHLSFGVFVDDLDGGYEMSPEFETLSEAITSAMERTDFVIARGLAGPYYWYGRGPQPPDIDRPPSTDVNREARE